MHENSLDSKSLSFLFGQSLTMTSGEGLQIALPRIVLRVMRHAGTDYK
jgi:hypothetical protein